MKAYKIDQGLPTPVPTECLGQPYDIYWNSKKFLL